jgi:hypothetical protein
MTATGPISTCFMTRREILGQASSDVDTGEFCYPQKGYVVGMLMRGWLEKVLVNRLQSIVQIDTKFSLGVKHSFIQELSLLKGQAVAIGRCRQNSQWTMGWPRTNFALTLKSAANPS